MCRFCLAASVLALCVVACDRSQLLEPRVDAALTSAAGATVKAPSNASAIAVSESGIDLAWQDNSTNESGFEAHRSTTGPSGTFALLASLGANVTSYSNSGLSASSQYCYKVRAFRAINSKTSYSAFSSPACASTLAPPVPVAPSGVNTAPYFGAAIAITWTDNATNETGFRTERSATVVGPWTTVSTQTPNVTSVHDSAAPGLEQLSCYRVFAYNSYGDSDPSNVDCTALPAAPTNLSASVTANAVDLAWIDNSAVEDGYEVLRNASVIGTLPANSTTFHDAGVTTDNIYSYAVRATKDGGVSGASNVVRVVIATTPPAAPGGTDARPQGSHGAVVAWRDNATNDEGFRVERSTDNGASWVAAGTTPDTSFSDGALVPEQSICYRVIAYNSAGESLPSNTDCTTPPAGPTNLTATFVDNIYTLVFAWEDNSGVEDGFEVWVIYYDGTSSVFTSLGANTTGYLDSSAWCWWYYCELYVVAIKDGGRSDPSNLTFPTTSWEATSPVRGQRSQHAPRP